MKAYSFWHNIIHIFNIMEPITYIRGIYLEKNNC